MSQDDSSGPEPDAVPSNERVKYPPEIQFSGFAWVFVAVVQVFGLVMVFVTLGETVPTPTQPPPAGLQFDSRGQPLPSWPAPPPPAAKPPVPPVLMAAVSVVVLFVVVVFFATGVQALTGSASSFFGAGVGSIFLGLLAVAAGVAQVIQSVDPIAFITSMLSALGALSGGVAAVTGSKNYNAWRTQQRALPKGQKRGVAPTASPRAKRPPAPFLSKLAGTCWLLSVAVLLAGVPIGVLSLGDVHLSVRPASASLSTESTTHAFAVVLVSLAAASLFCVVLTVVGIRAVVGSAAGFTVIGIATLTLGVLFAGLAWLLWVHSLELMAQAWAVTAALTLLGGCLGLIGRGRYASWRAAMKRLREGEGG